MKPLPENPQPIRIGELARRTGVTTRTLRFYEEMGLITPSGHSRGGFREYDPGQIRRIEAILALKAAGFQLEEIRELQKFGGEPMPAASVAERVRGSLGARTEEMRTTISRLQGSLADLERIDTLLKECQDCERTSFDPACRDCLDQKCDGEVPAGLSLLIQAGRG